VSNLSKIGGAAVLWGTTGVAVALLRENPVTVGFYRLAIAAVVLLAIARPFALIRAMPIRVVRTGVFLGAYQALYFIAVANAGVGVATMVSLGIAPIALTLWEGHRRRLYIPAMAVAGLVLISAGPSGGAPRPWLGLGAAVLSGLGYAVSALLGRDLAGRGDPLALTTATSAVGALALLPVAAIGGLAVPARPGTLGLLLYLGVVTTALAYGLFYAGLRGVPGSAATVVTLLEPVTAAILAAAFLGETLTVWAMLGGVLVLSAVVALAVAPPAVAVAPQEA
jgi:drug/metabolite transporter (DMT)-like permease